MPGGCRHWNHWIIGRGAGSSWGAGDVLGDHQVRRLEGHKRIDETMIYVYVAEPHRRDLPESIVSAASGDSDPDRRTLKMLSARGSGWQ